MNLCSEFIKMNNCNTVFIYYNYKVQINEQDHNFGNDRSNECISIRYRFLLTSSSTFRDDKLFRQDQNQMMQFKQFMIY